MDLELKQQFDEMGIEPNDEFIAKAEELCVSYNVENATDFVEQFMAYSISKLPGVSSDEPEVDWLNEFERKVLQSKRDKELAAFSKKKNNKYTNLNNLSNHISESNNPLAMYGVQNIEAHEGVLEGYMDVEAANDKVYEDAVCHTPKASKGVLRTPARKRDAPFSPASYSPLSGTPRSNLATVGSGKVVYTFGNATLLASTQWNSNQGKEIKIQHLLKHNGESLGSISNGKYMLDSLKEKCEIAGDRVFQVGQNLCRKVFGSDSDEYILSQVDVHSQNSIKTIGTVCCDHEGPLDASSTLLVGSDEMRCRTVRLNFSQSKNVAVFPGQVILVSGIKPSANVLMVEEVVNEGIFEQPTPPKLTCDLSFVIAVGPFTNDDDLVYDPLQDLMLYLKDHRPDVLILIGPFVDANHRIISENITLAETFETFFEKMIASIIETVGRSTTVLIVASYKDANCEPVYPTMPIALKHSYPNVHLLPDPSCVDINGLTIGLTSTDIVDHILSQELAVNAGDKVKRVVNYLFQQRSYYPLSPPIENTICFDSALASKFASLECIPNIILLPSDQKCFIRVVNGCLAINPGRLAAVDKNNGGTFARFIITPPAACKDETNIFNYVACQVQKI